MSNQRTATCTPKVYLLSIFLILVFNRLAASHSNTLTKSVVKTFACFSDSLLWRISDIYIITLSHNLYTVDI